jgi:hypothetical protein
VTICHDVSDFRVKMHAAEVTVKCDDRSNYKQVYKFWANLRTLFGKYG